MVTNSIVVTQDIRSNTTNIPLDTKTDGLSTCVAAHLIHLNNCAILPNHVRHIVGDYAFDQYCESMACRAHGDHFGVEMIYLTCEEIFSSKIFYLQEDNLLGSAAFIIREKILEIWAIGVIRPNEGIGTHLLSTLEEYAKSIGKTQMVVSGATEESKGFYQKMGFNSCMIKSIEQDCNCNQGDK